MDTPAKYAAKGADGFQAIQIKDHTADVTNSLIDLNEKLGDKLDDKPANEIDEKVPGAKVQFRHNQSFHLPSEYQRDLDDLKLRLDAGEDDIRTIETRVDKMKKLQAELNTGGQSQ